MITLSGGNAGGTVVEQAAAVGEMLVVDSCKYEVRENGVAVFVGVDASA